MAWKTIWSAPRLERLRDLWARGFSASEIGRLMGVSKNAVIGAVHRLGLPSRPSPIRAPRQDARRPLRLSPSAHAHLPLPVGAGLAPAAAIAKPPLAAAPARLVEPPAPAREITPRRDPWAPKRCAWPIGEPRDREFRFCCEPSASGRPYCEAHAARAYLKTSRQEGMAHAGAL